MYFLAALLGTCFLTLLVWLLKDLPCMAGRVLSHILAC